MSMDDIAFNDWPGQPVDLSGSNSWLPAYGFQPPSSILEKDDFLNSADAALFLNGSVGNQFVFLETIVEETSDDLRSDSERSASRNSRDSSGALGWLATDSESGSVIRVNVTGIDLNDDSSTSESELVCPAKRPRRQIVDTNLLAPSIGGFSDDESSSLPSLSRSSSLLQFETLEKRCQEDVHNSSPSILSTFSYDSLENHQNRKRLNLSPDSLNINSNSDSSDTDSCKSDSEYYSSTKIKESQTSRNKNKRTTSHSNHSRDSLFYKTKILESKNCDADGESSCSSNASSDSEMSNETILNNTRSLKEPRNLKSYRSFENLKSSNDKKTDKVSAENLSEDSGYCDHLFMKLKSSSIPNFSVQGIVVQENSTVKHSNELRKTYKRKSHEILSTAKITTKTSTTKKVNEFGAYDGIEACFQTSSASYFGASYQDLSIFDPNKFDFKTNLKQNLHYDFSSHKFNWNSLTKQSSNKSQGKIEETEIENDANSTNNVCVLASEIVVKTTTPKISFSSASEPNLFSSSVLYDLGRNGSYNENNFHKHLDKFSHDKHSIFDYFEQSVCVVSSVPKDLNLLGSEEKVNENVWNVIKNNSSPSIATKNWDLCDIAKDNLQFTDDFSEFVLKSQSDNKKHFDMADKTHGNRNKMAGDNKRRLAENIEIVDDSTIIIRLKERNYDADDVTTSRNRNGVVINSIKSLNDSSFNDGITDLLDITDSARKYSVDSDIDFGTNMEKTVSNSSIPSFSDEKDDLFFHSTPINKRTVFSTPNLTTFDSEIDFLKNVNDNYLLRGSTQDVPSNKIQETHVYSKSLTNSEEKFSSHGCLVKDRLPGSGSSTKGVHFCPIVSEVSWREASFSDDQNSEYDISTDTEEEHSDEEKPKSITIDETQNTIRETHNDNKTVTSDGNEPQKLTIDVNNDTDLIKKINNTSVNKNITTDINEQFINNEKQYSSTPAIVGTKVKKDDEVILDEDGYIVKTYVCKDGTTFKHTYIGSVYKRGGYRNKSNADNSTPTSTKESSHVVTAGGESVATAPTTNNNSAAPVPPVAPKRTKSGRPVNSSMASKNEQNNAALTTTGAAASVNKPSKHSSNKFGGFLSRFTNFRFSTRGNKKSSNKLNNVEIKNNIATTNKNNTASTQPNKNASTSTAAVEDKTDYIYIPLKGPINAQETVTVHNENILNNVNNVKSINKILIDGKPVQMQVQQSNNSNKINSELNNSNNISSKPPLPKLPPRVVSVKQRERRGSDNSAITQAYNNNSGFERNVIDSKGSFYRGNNVFRRAPSMEHPMGLIETDLDTHVTVINAHPGHHQTANNGGAAKARSLMNLGGPNARFNHPSSLTAHGAAGAVAAIGCGAGDYIHQGAPGTSVVRPHKSMEFLLDKENLKVVEPPENELQKVGTERVMSEHQLRVQRSLQKLTVPEWFKQSQVPREGFLLKKQRDSSTKWSTLTGKTTSLSSLGGVSNSSTRQSPILLSPSPQGLGFSRWSTSKLNSTASSPCNSTRSSFNYRQPITGLTSNGTVSPCSSTRSSFNYRAPYLGWRSQERLAKPRTPAERLATSLLTNQNNQNSGNSEIQSSIKEVTSAIVHYVSGTTNPRIATTEAPLVDSLSVNDPRRKDSNGSSPRYDRESTSTSPRFRDYETQDTVSQRSRSISPSSRGSQKLCWLESSFVGTRPLDSPQTPIGLPSDISDTSTETIRGPGAIGSNYPNLHLDLKTKTNVNTESLSNSTLSASLTTRPSPGSTTLEDVLDSLLGLPPSTRAPSPSLQETASVNSSPGQHNRFLSLGSTAVLTPWSQSRTTSPSIVDFRRRSEGSDALSPSTKNNNQLDVNDTSKTPTILRRVSFHVTPVPPNPNEPSIRCRYSKCSTVATPEDARKYFKHCHNCNYVYCSRECRRAHWEKHRKTCLHSRASSLCRQILAKAKDDSETLNHISLLARRGYLSLGPGVVKCFFASPEAAERFVANGLPNLGEPAYVRWPDLLPSEMGPELFSELVKICKSYNPESRLVLYVAVCVVSEVPTTGTIKWERQLVSRCAKLRLNKAVVQNDDGQILIQSSSSMTRPKSPCNITREMDNPETLILTSLPGCRNQMSVQRSREISFTNIQRQLKQRGVSLKRHFPDVYQKLRAYVEGASDKFAPVTVYPRDSVSGKNFMCIIMPDTDSDKLDLVPTDSTRVQTIDVGQTSDQQE